MFVGKTNGCQLVGIGTASGPSWPSLLRSIRRFLDWFYLVQYRLVKTGNLLTGRGSSIADALVK